MQKKRLSEISVMNVILCIMTVFIHIISYPVSSLTSRLGSVAYTLVMLIWRLSVVVVPGFIMLAACKLFLKISVSDSFSYLAYYKGRAKRLILPYFIWFLLYYILFMFFWNYTADPGFMLQHFLLGSLVYHFYFIPLLVQFDVLIPLWRRIISGASPVFVIPAALIITTICESFMPDIIRMLSPGATFLYNDRIATSYLVYWLAGAYIGANYEKFKELILRNKTAVSVIFSLAAICNILFSYFAYNQICSVPFMNTIQLFYTLASLMFLYMLCLAKGDAVYTKIKSVALIDKVSYRIYLCHVMVLMGVDFILEKCGIIAQLPSTLLRIVLVYGISIVFSIAIEKILLLFKKVQN